MASPVIRLPVIPEAEASAEAIRDLARQREIPARDDLSLRAAIIEAGMTGRDGEWVAHHAG